MIGIIPDDASFGAYCLNDALATDTGSSDPLECTNILDVTTLMKDILIDCDLQTSCTIDHLDNYLIVDSTTPSDYLTSCGKDG